MARKKKDPTPAFPDLEAKRHHATRNQSTLGNWLCLPGRFLPWFVLSHNLPTTSVYINLALFCAFLSCPARSLRIHWPTILSPRTTPTPARRGQVALQALPAGYCLPPTGARSQRAASIIQYGTKPGDSCAQILGTHRATHVSSCGRTWVAPSMHSSARVFHRFTTLRRHAIKNGVEQGHGTQPNRLGMKDLWPSASKYSANPPASVRRVPCPRPRPRLAVGSVIGIPRRNGTMRRGYDVSGAGPSSLHPHARLCSGLRFHGRNRSTSSIARPPAWAHASR